MTQEEGLYEEYDDNDEIIQIKTCGVITGIFRNIVAIGINNDCKLVTVKPYLRPMSSMTEEEDTEWQLYKDKIAESCDELLEKRIAELYDWFCKKHLDYRGLIPMGLALEAPEGMYSN